MFRETARKLMEAEGQAILGAAARVGTSLDAAVEAILRRTPPGKVVTAGVGKSGHLARHLAATLQSTGTPAVFLHPSDATHGDLGLCQPGDVMLMISKSGCTGEIHNLAEAVRAMDVAMVGILGNPKSPLAGRMDAVLDASVSREADPQGFVPTSSSTVALALGHALAIALMEARGFTAADYARLHAGGQLGRSLRQCVADAMHRGDEVAWVAPGDSLKAVVIAMSRRPLGATCVGDGQALAGIITDGDLRRALQTHDDIRDLRAGDVMTASPTTVAPGALLKDALILMEDRPSQISVLPVVDDSGTCLGLLRLHDIYQNLEQNPA